MVNDRLMARDSFYNSSFKQFGCNNEEPNATLFLKFCPESTFTINSTESIQSVECAFFRAATVRWINGIPGLSSGVFYSKMSFLIYSKNEVNLSLLTPVGDNKP